MNSNAALKRARRQPATRGFTLVELVSVGMLLALLVVLGLPTFVRANQKTKSMCCRANLRQLGVALQTYADGNHGLLPGPVWPLATSQYDGYSTNQLAWFIAERTGSPRPSLRTNFCPQLMCPSHAPAWTGASKHAADYALNDGRGLVSAPFGRLSPSVLPPGNLSLIAAATSPATCLAISDADKGNVNPTLPGWNELSYEPAHGKIRNRLYFDWHVESQRW